MNLQVGYLSWAQLGILISEYRRSFEKLCCKKKGKNEWQLEGEVGQAFFFKIREIKINMV